MRKPKMSKKIYFDWGILAFGLIGLGFVAFHSFTVIGEGPVPSLAFSALIEYGLIMATINLARGNRLSWFEIVISLIVSAIYNYINMRAVNINSGYVLADKEQWLLFIFGVGPLAIEFTAALMAGKEYSKFEVALANWEKSELAKAEAKQVEADNRVKAKEAEDARIAEETRKHQWEVEEKEKIAKIASEERIQLSKIAEEEKTKRKEIAVREREISVEKTEVAEIAEKLPKRKYADFVNDMKSNGHHKYTAKEISEKYGISERQGRTWLKDYESESHPQPVVELN